MTRLASQLDPQSMIDAFVRIAEEHGSKFRNAPDETPEWLKGLPAKTGKAGKDDAIWTSPPTGERRVARGVAKVGCGRSSVRLPRETALRSERDSITPPAHV